MVVGAVVDCSSGLLSCWRIADAGATVCLERGSLKVAARVTWGLDTEAWSNALIVINCYKITNI